MNRVEAMKADLMPHKYDNIKDILKSAADNYMAIRAKLEVLGGDRWAVVSHIKSFPDWEYFIDNFNETILSVTMFNNVQVYPDKIILRHSDLGSEDIYFHTQDMGVCTLDDLLNIEKIIEDRKNYYKEQEKTK
jgi:hypothetical protein